MRKFDTKVQHLKYKVLREVARQDFNGKLLDNIFDIPSIIVPGKEATMRCCVYKERAIISERIRLAMGGDKKNPNMVEVIEVACDECPVGGYEITESCRGCIAHHCEEVCKKNAITFDRNQRAYIDKSKCVECGLCANVCPFSAIINYKRPCENACKINAISMSETKAAFIDNDKCISCGACVNQCPFGAIMDKSFILDAVNLIKEYGGKNKLYAVVAPSIAAQFTYAKPGQIIAGIKKLGFYDVIEAAEGADIVAYEEAGELVEKGFLTSSCCPAFVDHIKRAFPELEKHISHNLSPMAMISKCIKEKDEDAKIIFIGPCIAKKAEVKLDTVSQYVDCVITFEELQALFDSRDLDILSLDEDQLEGASFFGRIFARGGGLSEAVKQALDERNVSDFELKPVTCDGMDNCHKTLLRASKNALDGNFIEGMACVGGCIGGAGCLSHSAKNKIAIDNHAKHSPKKYIKNINEDNKCDE